MVRIFYKFTKTNIPISTSQSFVHFLSLPFYIPTQPNHLHSLCAGITWEQKQKNNNIINLKRKTWYAAGCRRTAAKGFAKVAACVFCASNALPAFECLSPLCIAAEHRRYWRGFEKAQKSWRHKKCKEISKKWVIRETKVWKRDTKQMSKCPHPNQARAEKTMVILGLSLPSSQELCPTTQPSDCGKVTTQP